MFGNILNGFTNPFPNNNNNPRNVIVDLSDTNNRDNRPLFLAKKSKRFVAKRTKENTKYVRLNYKEFMKINKKIKSSIGSYIEQENIAYNNDQAYGRIGDANRHLKAKEYYEKLISDKFPILNDLNVTHVNYPDFKINNIVQTVKDLKKYYKRYYRLRR